MIWHLIIKPKVDISSILAISSWAGWPRKSLSCISWIMQRIFLANLYVKPKNRKWSKGPSIVKWMNCPTQWDIKWWWKWTGNNYKHQFGWISNTLREKCRLQWNGHYHNDDFIGIKVKIIISLLYVDKQPKD